MSTAPRVAVDTRAAGSSISSRGSFQPEQSPWQRFKGRFDTKVVPYLLISPFFILFAVFGIFPLIYNGVVSFRRWNLKNPTNDGWAGFDNYTKLFSDGFFANALVNTFGIFLLSTIPQLLLALFVASLLNRRLRAQTLFRVGVLVPFVTPIVASSEELAAALRAEAAVQSVLDISRSADHAVVGIGAVVGQVTLAQVGYASQEELDAGAAAGAVGDILGVFYDSHGQVVDLPIHRRRIGIELDDLRAIPNVVGVAGGMSKFDAILGALRGGLLDVLVTTENVARALLEVDGGDS